MSLNIDDYFRTAFAEKLAIPMPERGVLSCGSTRLLELRREESEVERALNSTKEEFLMRAESLQQRREDLQSKEQELKSCLLKFDKFLKENDCKRERAARRARQESELSGRKRGEAEELARQLLALGERGESVRESVGRAKPALEFLESVLHASTEFQEARDLLSRYDTLLSSRSELEARSSACAEAAARVRAARASGAGEERRRQLGLGARISRMRAELEDARSRGDAAESTLSHIEATATTKTLLLGQLRLAIRNIYELVGSQLPSQRAGPLPLEDTEGQLTQIQMFVEDLGAIVKELKRGNGGGGGGGGH